MEYEVVVSVNLISALAGAVLSVAFSYVPGLSDWFGALDGIYKRLVMAGTLLSVSLALFTGVCAGIVVGDGLTCGRDGVLILLSVLWYALVANQTAYIVGGVSE